MEDSFQLRNDPRPERQPLLFGNFEPAPIKREMPEPALPEIERDLTTPVATCIQCNKVKVPPGKLYCSRCRARIKADMRRLSRQLEKTTLVEDQPALF